MASQSANECWTYDAQYQRYSRQIYDYTQGQWVFANWMPVGFHPAQIAQQSNQPTVTSQTASVQSPPYQQGSDNRPRNDSVLTSPGQVVRSAAAGSGAGYAVSYGGSSQQYGPGSPGPTSSHTSSWPSSSSAQQHGQPHATFHGQPVQSQPSAHMSTLGHGGRPIPKRKGQRVRGTYEPGTNNVYYEKIDTTFYVRDRKFFQEGRVFAVMMNETAGATSSAAATSPDATDYNSSKSVTAVRYQDNYVYTNVRRFIVVRAKREFCYAIPIFTYSGRATTKRGVRPSEHGIAYSWGQKAQLLPGEGGITKPSIAVVMASGVTDLHIASRIYYGIMHPIQYNVKVKEIGYVPQTYMPHLIGNWKAEEDNDTGQAAHVTENADIAEEPEEEDEEEEEEEDDDEDNEYEDDTPQAGPSSAPNVSQDVDSLTYSVAYMKRPSQE